MSTIRGKPNDAIVRKIAIDNRIFKKKFIFWCPLSDSNRPPTDYKSVALPNELKGLC